MQQKSAAKLTITMYILSQTSVLHIASLCADLVAVRLPRVVLVFHAN